jgi:hypothetical protein
VHVYLKAVELQKRLTPLPGGQGVASSMIIEAARKTIDHLGLF